MEVEVGAQTTVFSMTRRSRCPLARMVGELKPPPAMADGCRELQVSTAAVALPDRASKAVSDAARLGDKR